MKLTRSEKAAASAVKVANAMYKAAKAPTQDEFFWDERDYLSPEELFWIDLDAILADVKAPAELKAEVYEYTKEDEPRAAFDPVSHYSYRDSRNGVFFIE